MNEYSFQLSTYLAGSGISMEYIKTVVWDFGDGRTSTEYNPNHTYSMPGIYNWVLIVTDLFGRTVRTTGTIYVYDWDYHDDRLHVAYTDTCYRFALTPTQGVGAVEWAGTYWLWPTAYTGTCKGMDDVGETVSLVCNNANGRFYRVGIRDLWQDRKGAYGGTDIACSFRLKEHTAVAGEYEEIEHVESHVHMRPYWEENRGETGFTAEGFPDNYALGLRIYENGEQNTPTAKLTQVPRYGDYVYRNRVEARRLQLEVTMDTSAWRCIKVQQQLMPINKVSGPDFDYPSESSYQYEFRTPDLWMSRDSYRPTLNRATGTNFSGTYDNLGTGPDAYLNSCVNFAVGQGLSYPSMTSLTGDFTLGIWVGHIGPAPITLWQATVSSGATLVIRLVQVGANYAVQFNDGSTGDQRLLSWSGTGWVFIAIEKSGTNLLMFENGVQLSTVPLVAAGLGYGGTVQIGTNCICSIFDARRIPRAVSAAALAYYYDDVVNNQGNGGLLPIRK